MTATLRKKEVPESNILETLWFKFFPYWPLFAILSLLFLLLAFAFTMYRQPSYNVNASLIINNDDNVINTNNQAFQALNAFTTRQVVDNEVLVLKSRTLMSKVVDSLHLYASVYEKSTLSDKLAYLSSPVVVEVREPRRISKKEQIDFVYNQAKGAVVVKGKEYRLNQWINFTFSDVRFIRNPNQKGATKKQLYALLQNPAVAAENHLKDLNVSTVSKQATTINLSFKTEVPQKGEAVLNSLLRQYLRSLVENEVALAENTLAFVDERLRDVEQELDSIERGIQRFRSEEGVIDLSEQGRIYLESVAENDRRIVELNAQLAVIDQVERYVNAEGRTPGIVPTSLGIEDPVLAQLLQRLNELELQLANVRTTTGSNNPLVKSIENEIQKIRPNIRSIVNNQRARLTASRNNLSTTSNRLNENIRAIPQQERGLLEISRQQAVKRDLYAFLLQRREEAALNNATPVVRNRVVDWADAAIATPGSGKLIILLGSIIAACAIGLVYLIFKEGLTSKVLFRSEAEKLTSLPIIGEIPYRRKRRRSVQQIAADPMLARELNQLQVALGLYDGGGGLRKKILVTSSRPNEGASFISNHFAINLAKTGKRVLLIDLDLHDSEVSTIYHLHDEKGIAEFVHGEQGLSQLVHKTEFSNLDVLPAGNKGDNTLQTLLHSRLEEVFHFADSRYDFIILDTPPIDLYTDAYALSRYIDCTLLVIRHGVTPRTTLKKFDANPKLESFKELNIVINGIKGRGFPLKYYGYGFGYGYETIPKYKTVNV